MAEGLVALASGGEARIGESHVPPSSFQPSGPTSLVNQSASCVEGPVKGYQQVLEAVPMSYMNTGQLDGQNASSARTTSDEIETDTKDRELHSHEHSGGTGSDDHEKAGDKTARRLAQNREAARKSRLRKKAYVQQLESSRIRLQQLEQELQRARQQGAYGHMDGGQAQLAMAGNVGPVVNPNVNPGVAQFDLDYARWVEEEHRLICDLRSALQARVPDHDVKLLIDQCMQHYEEMFRMKKLAARADVFHIVSGMWKTPAERCFMWIGGFRPSEMLKIVMPQVEPLSDQQLVSMCGLQQSSQQAEDHLSQGMEGLQQSLADTLSSGALSISSNVANYMGQMAMAMGKLGTLENFVCQADNLRLQTLQQMHRMLTVRQSARAFLAIGDYFARLRALSSLWSARPRD